MSRFWIELIGYIGSGVVLISFMMSNVIRLRVINIIGGAISTIYSLIVGAYPVALMNVCLIAINLVQIWKLTHETTIYQAVWTGPEDGSLQYLLKQYEQDIKTEWDPQNLDQANLAGIIYAKGTPASFFLAKKDGDQAEMLLDYAIPAYRDASAGKYLYDSLKELGLKSVYTTTDKNPSYFEKLGFARKQNQLQKTL